MGQEQSMDQGNGASGNRVGSGIGNLDNRANQRNPNNHLYWRSRDYDARPSDWQDLISGRNAPRGNDNNRANQLNPNNPTFLRSRGMEEVAGSNSSETVSTDQSMDMLNVVGNIVQAGIVLYQLYSLGNWAYETYQQNQEENDD